LASHGLRDLPYLDSIGFLGPDMLAVHCVECDDDDIDLLAHRDVKVSHNPCSNLYLASGFAKIPRCSPPASPSAWQPTAPPATATTT